MQLPVALKNPSVVRPTGRSKKTWSEVAVKRLSNPKNMLTNATLIKDVAK